MKKKYIPMSLVVLMVISISVSAAVMRSTVIMPDLSFSNGNANCVLSVVAANNDDLITAEIRLYRGIFRVKKWEAEAVGILAFNETTSAATGATYTMEVDVTVGGVEYSTRSVTNTNNTTPGN